MTSLARCETCLTTLHNHFVSIYSNDLDYIRLWFVFLRQIPVTVCNTGCWPDQTGKKNTSTIISTRGSYPGSREPSIPSKSCRLFLLCACLKTHKGSTDTANHFHNIPYAPFIITALLGSVGYGKSKLEDLSWMSRAPERKHRHRHSFTYTTSCLSHQPILPYLAGWRHIIYIH